VNNGEIMKPVSKDDSVDIICKPTVVDESSLFLEGSGVKINPQNSTLSKFLRYEKALQEIKSIGDNDSLKLASWDIAREALEEK